MRSSSLLFLSLAFFACLIAPAYGELIFYDSVAIKDTPQMLRAETRGRVFKKGGEMVEFFVDTKSLGKSLSGGDGSAFREFTPKKRGLYAISVSSGKEKETGFLLSLVKNNRVIFIDVEGTVFIPLSNKPHKNSQKVVNALSRKFSVVYLQRGLLDIKVTRSWLKENEFADAPILPWQDGAVFDELNKKEIKIKFIIGTANVIESAKAYKPKAFSFEETEGAEEVKDWEDMGKKLKIMIK